MKDFLGRKWALLVVLGWLGVMPGAALAQPAVTPTTASDQPIPRAARRWNADAGIGLFSMPTLAIDKDLQNVAGNRTTRDPWTSASFEAGVGRYWNAHLKSELALAIHRQLATLDFERVPFAPLAEGAEVFTDKTIDLTTCSMALAYQFREDAFIHPYVTGGLQLAWRREHRFREAREYTDYIGPYPSRPVRYTAAALDEHNDRWLMHPYVGVGSKFYVTRSMYLRPEVTVTLGSGGGWLSTTRVNVGVDF